MLVLSREASQQLVIGEEIVVTVLQVSENRVRLGIAAPDSVKILRGELERYITLEADLTTPSVAALEQEKAPCHE